MQCYSASTKARDGSATEIGAVVTDMRIDLRTTCKFVITKREVCTGRDVRDIRAGET